MIHHNLGSVPVYGCYKLIHLPTGKYYIGSGNLQKRCNFHCWAMKNNRHKNRYIQELYDSDKTENAWLFQPLSVTTEKPSNEELKELEDKFIADNWGDPLLLNIANKATGGRGSGFLVSNETRNKLGIINTGKKMKPESIEKMRAHAPVYRENWEETKLKIAANNWHNPDVQRAKSEKLTGRKYSIEHRQAISRALAGRVISKEQIEKIRLTKLANKWRPTEEQRRKMSLMRIGTTFSLQTKRKKSTPIVANWVEFYGQAEAVKALGIGRGALYARLKRQAPGYYYLDDSCRQELNFPGVKTKEEVLSLYEFYKPASMLQRQLSLAIAAKNGAVDSVIKDGILKDL